MEERYEFTADFEILRGLLKGFPIYVIFIVVEVLIHIRFPEGSILESLSLIIFIAFILVLLGLRGTVQADTEGVNIKIKLFVIPITVRSYYYEDIRSVNCAPSHHRTRSLNYYSMDFVFTLSNGKELWFKKKLKYSKGQYTTVGCESMLELCTYVRRCKKGIYDENRPQ